jgi:hypothetical protein
MNREENDQGTMMQLFDLVSKLIATVPQNKTFRDDPKRSIKQTFMFLDIVLNLQFIHPSLHLSLEMLHLAANEITAKQTKLWLLQVATNPPKCKTQNFNR